MNPISVLIVDDEPLARSSIRRLLAAQTGYEIAAEAADGAAALELIRRLRPQLVFLDVQMPEMTGLEVLAQLGPHEWPAIIFTTAYDEHALKAFELHAVDYLLKPYKDVRFAQALARARERIHAADPLALAANVQRALAVLRGAEAGGVPPASPPATLPDRLVVKINGEFQFLPLADIRWIEGHGDYLKVHGRTGAPLIRDTFKELQSRLAPGRFLRIHKSAMVNVDYIHKLRPVSSGDYEMELVDGTRLRVSRLNKAVLDRYL